MSTMQAGTQPQEARPESAPSSGAWPPMSGMATVKRHMASIEAICAEVERPFEEVAGVYQCELLRLSAQAAVHDYLPVLVGKRVRELYRRRRQARDGSDPCAKLIGGL